jgi:hypothetical protein
MIIWGLGSVAVALLVWITLTAWLDDLMPEPVASAPEPVAAFLVLKPELAEALGRLQDAHATATRTQAAAEAAIAANLVAKSAKAEAKKQLHAAIDAHFPD